jgi:hypothetical protein
MWALDEQTDAGSGDPVKEVHVQATQLEEVPGTRYPVTLDSHHFPDAIARTITSLKQADLQLMRQHDSGKLGDILP